MDSYKFLNIEFLQQLRIDTESINPNLIAELFAIYFASFPGKMAEIDQHYQESNVVELLKVLHYMKGQSACVGFTFYANIFLKMETLIKSQLKSQPLKAVDALFSKLKNELKNDYSDLHKEATRFMQAKERS